MFASYSKRGRSLSTTDVYRLGKDDEEDRSREASFSRMLARKQIRRPRTKPPAVPGLRSASDSNEPATLTRVRSYLSDDIRQEFESTARNSADQQSPSTSNFVKRLVASLERRQKDIVKPDKRIFREASFGESGGRDRAASFAIPRPFIEFSSRTSQLEEVHEAENEAENEAEKEDDEDDKAFEDSDSSEPDEYFSDMWAARSLEDKLPVICSYPAEPIKPNNGRRSLIKNVFSTLANWRIGGKGLAKGSRDYYAARESLGEEMRAFRRDTMPRLMEHAAHKSRLQCELSGERPRRDTQDFAKLIPRPANAPSQRQQQPSPRSLATIHPIYKASTHQLHLAVEPALPPVQQQQLQQLQPLQNMTSISPDEQLLLRPSRMRELQKRLSREINTLARVQMTSSVQYDVPKSNRPVAAVVRQYPQYQNLPAVSQDKRLSCSLFTTF